MRTGVGASVSAAGIESLARLHTMCYLMRVACSGNDTTSRVSCSLCEQGSKGGEVGQRSAGTSVSTGPHTTYSHTIHPHTIYPHTIYPHTMMWVISCGA